MCNYKGIGQIVLSIAALIRCLQLHSVSAKLVTSLSAPSRRCNQTQLYFSYALHTVFPPGRMELFENRQSPLFEPHLTWLELSGAASCFLVLTHLQSPILIHMWLSIKEIKRTSTFFFQTSMALFSRPISNRNQVKGHISCNSVQVLWNHISSRYSNYTSRSPSHHTNTYTHTSTSNKRLIRTGISSK